MEQKSKKIGFDVVFIGLALFATYFGAGNLIFPPILGLQSGTNWIYGLIGLVLSGILLPVAAMVVIGKRGSVHGITGHVGKQCYNIIVGAIMFIVLFVANPRTAAVGIELGLQGIFPGVPYVPCVIGYFLLVFFFARNKGKALDNIGKYLTPVMVVILLILIIKGIISPVGTPVEVELKTPFVNAFLGGYQTGDALVSFLFAGVFLGTIESKGYDSKEDRNKVTLIAAVIAFAGLFIVYGGLLYMGACGGADYPSDIGRAELLVGLVNTVGGRIAASGLGLATILACLTTAVGQATSASDYFVTLSGNRFDYQITTAVCCVISALIALIGVDKIVKFSDPIYMAIYPLVLVLVVLGIFAKFIPNDGGYKGAIILTAVFSVCEGIASIGGPMEKLGEIVGMLPFASQGFGWVLPCAVGLIGGILIYPKVSKKMLDRSEI